LFAILSEARSIRKLSGPLSIMYYVYILQSLKDKKTYVGYTTDLQKRLEYHNSGRVPATKCRRPLKLLFSEKFSTMTKAKKQELYWKSGAGRRKLKQYFEKGFPI